MADGGCAGCFCYHAEFSGRDTVLYPAHDQAYFTSAITTLVIGWICAFLLCNGCVGWQFARITQSELKKQTALLVGICTSLFRLSCGISFFMSRQRKLRCWRICAVFSDSCLATPEFFAILVSTGIDFVGPISAQLGFALGYYCQWRKNRSQIRKWSEWGTCLSFVTLGMMAWALR